MRWCCVLIALAALSCAAHRADAAVLVNVDISHQTMSVAVDGTTRYRWTISTGRQGYVTPNGTYRPQRLARHWYSRKYGGAMPYAVFFHKGWAIHGTTEVRRLGRPASHGCIRLHPKNAAVLFGLVRQARSTRIIISGSRPSLMADGGLRPRPKRARVAVSQRLLDTQVEPREFSRLRRYGPPRAYFPPRTQAQPDGYRWHEGFAPARGYGPLDGDVIVDPGD